MTCGELAMSVFGRRPVPRYCIKVRGSKAPKPRRARDATERSSFESSDLTPVSNKKDMTAMTIVILDRMIFSCLLSTTELCR